MPASSRRRDSDEDRARAVTEGSNDVDDPDERSARRRAEGCDTTTTVLRRPEGQPCYPPLNDWRTTRSPLPTSSTAGTPYAYRRYGILTMRFY